MTVILIILMFSSLIVSFSDNPVLKNKYVIRTIIFSLIIYFSIMISSNLIEGTDLSSYIKSGEVYKSLNFIDLIKTTFPQSGLPIVQWIYFNFFNLPFFRFTVGLLSILPILYGFKKSLNYQDLIILILCLFICFFYINGATNIFKQSIATAFYLGGIALFLKNFKINAYVFFIFSIFFHLSVAPFVILFIFIYYIKISIKKLIILNVVTIVLFITNLNRLLFSNIYFFGEGSQYARYANDVVINQYGGVNRIDFLLFNYFFIILFALCRKYFFKNDNYLFDNFYKVLLINNFIFQLSGFVAYSDRIAFYVWMIIPLLMTIVISKLKEVNKLYILGLFAVYILAFITNQGIFDLLQYYPFLFF